MSLPVLDEVVQMLECRSLESCVCSSPGAAFRPAGTGARVAAFAALPVRRPPLSAGPSQISS